MTAHDDVCSQAIRKEIRAASNEQREKYTWLRHQDAIGMAFFLASLTVAVLSGYLYLTGALPWWVTVPVTAICMGVVHEIEHDLIHRLYFTKRKAVVDAIFGIGWVMRPTAPNPWRRKGIHLLHHKVSGEPQDVEERAVGNGEPWGLKRLWIMSDPTAIVVLKLPKKSEASGKAPFVSLSLKFTSPMVAIAAALWYPFLALSVFNIGAGLFGYPPVTGTAASVLTDVVVVWIAPNMLRVFSLNFITSNLHYIGDVEPNNVLQQTQVLNKWWLFPMQLFCANFGSTHAIHHFVPGDPFWLRQMTAKRAHKVMRENGVRFNDLGTFRRNNRYTEQADGVPPMPPFAEIFLGYDQEQQARQSA